jgi:hypothetical protein
MNALKSAYHRSIVALVLTVAVAAAALLLLDGSDPSPSRAARPAASPSGALAQASARRETARAHVAALRRARSATRDALPPKLLGGPLMADGALDAATARKVAVADGGGWIASSGDGASVCAVINGALGCSSLRALTVDGTSPAIMGRVGEPIHVFGPASDDVSDLTLVHLDRRTESVTVTDNFYDVETDDWPRSLTWLGPDGLESFDFPPAP